MGFFWGLLVTFLAANVALAEADIWKRGTPVPDGGRHNPFNYPESAFLEKRNKGQTHAFQYPVEITGAQLPYYPIKRFLNEQSRNPLRALFQDLLRGFASIRSWESAMDWLGLHRFPATQPIETLRFAIPEGFGPGDFMGLTLYSRNDATAFTFSCAACHVGQLFGRPILGLTNRFPNANQIFLHGATGVRAVPTDFFALGTDSSEAEAELYRYSRRNILYVGGKAPETFGLDTSLAHVALSLARRGGDPHAEKSPSNAYFPREERLADFPADSKPAVWWNARYKNRWLSDGSVVAGNPILTNLLWNEIGRGTDLYELEDWIAGNQERIEELTTAVFSTEAPHITDFFRAERIDLQAAKRGEIVFNQFCTRCHGRYEKAWSAPGSAALHLGAQLKTVKVQYHPHTPVVDVGTDSHRREGIASLLQLNRLALSSRYGIEIEITRGYVPPPLVGIWARWPYLHNNSIPSLCELLTSAENRQTVYYSGEPNDPDRDFDFDCNGYPLGERTPREWIQPKHRFDTRRSGLSNSGHDEGIFLRNGEELLSPVQKRDLIQFLQTL